jgi:hypothetical protein
VVWEGDRCTRNETNALEGLPLLTEFAKQELICTSRLPSKPIYIDASKTTIDDNPALTPTQHFPYLSLHTFLAKLTISPQLPTFDFTEYAV